MKSPVRSVLCPTDGSPTSDAAVPVAFRLVADGGEVHLLHVCQPPMLGNPLYPPFEQGYVPTPSESEAGKQAMREALYRLVPPDAGARGVKTQFHLVDAANPSMAIAEARQELGADLVVMGTHGRTGLARFALGSVASDVLKRKVPAVLVFDAAANA